MAGELMLATVRVARGLTQAQLARQTGISQATLSKAESGLLQLDAGRLEILAQALDVPVELPSKPVDFAGPQAVVFHRKRASLPISAANRLRATLDLVHLQVGGLLDEGYPVVVPRIPLPDDGFVTPEEVAQETRQHLALPGGPIQNLVSALETAGVAVVHRDLGSLKVDALMSWPPGRRPVVLLGEHAPGDRQRFSMAHELGHAVMHQVPGEEQESEADRFASEFLMPAQDMRRLLRDVSVSKLARMKLEWGVSMAALLRRARDLDEITDSQYRRMNIEFSQAGYRTREPVDLEAEAPALLDEAVLGLVKQGHSHSDLAKKSWMTEGDFRTNYLREDAA